jgi:hypothetical protein
MDIHNKLQMHSRDVLQDLVTRETEALKVSSLMSE